MSREDAVRTRFTIVTLAALAMSPMGAGPSAGLDPEPRRPQCDSGHPYFDFQVDQPARFLGAPRQMPRPVGFWAEETVRVQFMLDRSGHAVDSTIRVFDAPDSATARRVRAAVPHWRFTPARQAGCRVWQVVNTAVRLG
jgi:hypothetical protein